MSRSSVSAKRYRRQSVLIALQEKFPHGIKLPPESPRVLSADCIEEAIVCLNGIFSEEDVRFAFSEFFKTPAYLKSICNKKWHRNLYGEKIELISQNEKDKARNRLDDINKNNSPHKKPIIVYKQT